VAVRTSMSARAKAMSMTGRSASLTNPCFQ
jgi:hypothetical protein